MTACIRYQHGVTIKKEDKICPGYVLFSPINNTRYQMKTWNDQSRVYLLDADGRIVHHWKVPGMIRLHAELLENGHLLCAIDDHQNPPSPSKGGLNLQFAAQRLVELDWDSHIVWEYVGQSECHDRCCLKNGNILLAEYKVVDPQIQRRVKGGMPGTEATVDAKVSSFAHLNLSKVAPQQVNMENWQYYVDEAVYQETCGDVGIMYTLVLVEMNEKGERVWEMDLSQALDTEIDIISPYGARQNWPGLNSFEEMPDGNILSTSYQMGCVFIWDKKTKQVKWRWGNLWNEDSRHRMSFPHDPTALPNGNILIFDNGRYHTPDPDGTFNIANPLSSRVIEVNPDTNEIVWEYRAENPADFYSCYISSARRLSNGNTIICEGTTGRLFEVTPEKEVVWEYISPFYSEARFRWGKNNSIYRCMKYEPDYPGIQGHVFDLGKCDKLNRLYGPDAFDVH